VTSTGEERVVAAIRSHIDLWLFVRIMRATSKDVPQEEIEELDKATDLEPAIRLWRKQYEAHPTTWFHELYHYWQGVRLPFLLWYASFSFRGAVTSFRDMMRTGLPFDQWDGVAPELGYMFVKMWCVHLGHDEFGMGFEEQEIPDNANKRVRLSPIDLLEGATSIAEWQVQSTTAAGSREFRRWCKRNPAYTDAFDFVACVLESDDLALRCFNPLIEASFHTSHPVRGFVKLLALFQKMASTVEGRTFINQAEPCRWNDLFQHLLSMATFEAEPDSMNGINWNTPFCRLMRETWVDASWGHGDFLHPYLTPNARAWQSKERENGAYGLVLSQFQWVDETVFWDCVNNFFPPVTLLHFSASDGTNRLIANRQPLVNGDADYTTSGSLLTLLTIVSVFRRALGSHFDPETRLCHHRDCPRYAGNYCNLYPVIPSKWENCGFPDRVGQIIEMFSQTP
jgi:hypothetical protein